MGNKGHLDSLTKVKNHIPLSFAYENNKLPIRIKIAYEESSYITNIFYSKTKKVLSFQSYVNILSKVVIR